MENLPQGSLSTHQQSQRRFLDRVPPQQRGPVCNLFLAPVRAGLTDPATVVRAVREEAMCRAHTARQWRQTATQAKMLELLAVLKAHPDEALDLARWALQWEALPRDHKRRIKAQRGETYRQAYQAEQPPTAKQLAYLRRLGHHGVVTSRLQASDLITQLLQGGRQSAR